MTTPKRAVLRALPTNESPAFPGYAAKGIRKLVDGSLEFSSGNDWSFLSSPLSVIALTRNSDGENWGRLLRVLDSDGREHQWAMPAAFLASRGDEILQTLYGLGARVAPGPAAALALKRYLTSEVSLEGERLPRARLASRCGWHGNSFALPDRALGSDEQVIYQSTSAIRPGIRSRGELRDWQSRIARHADGNSRLTVAICAAFAAPLLKPLGIEGFAIHFRGMSSSGKTTCLNLSGSVWGGPSDTDGSNGYKQIWRATANGFEGLAEAHCDLPLTLDELGQIRGEHAAQVAYQISGGLGTTRATRTGCAAARKEWRTLIVSTGEISLAEKVKESSSRMMAGQEVRFVDIPADAGRGLGLFDYVELIDGVSEKDCARHFAERLNSACREYFGTAGPAFVEEFINKPEPARAFVRRTMTDFQKVHARDTDGQVQRVASIFGFLAGAGELAASYGIVGWEPGNATVAAKRCFDSWLQSRGGRGPQEVQTAIAHLRLIIQRDGDSRFQALERIQSGKWQFRGNYPVKDRLGFVREVDGDKEYVIQPETWNELMRGRDATVAKQLAEKGVLKAEAGRPYKKSRLPGFPDPIRVYVVNNAILFADREEDQ